MGRGGSLGGKSRRGIEGSDGFFHVLRPLACNAVEVHLSQTVLHSGQIATARYVLERLLIGREGTFHGRRAAGTIDPAIFVTELAPHASEQIVAGRLAEGPRLCRHGKRKRLFDLLCPGLGCWLARRVLP